jgi:hypothetical protein
MSDRMPEDLPVRKCINAMVGIIRSEVIVFFEYVGSFGRTGFRLIWELGESNDASRIVSVHIALFRILWLLTYW